MHGMGEPPLREEEGPDEADADLIDAAAAGGADDDTATVECPHCSAEIYEDAERCPHCGLYVTAADPDLPARRSRSWAYLLLLAALAALLYWLLR